MTVSLVIVSGGLPAMVDSPVLTTVCPADSTGFSAAGRADPSFFKEGPAGLTCLAEDFDHPDVNSF